MEPEQQTLKLPATDSKEYTLNQMQSFTTKEQSSLQSLGISAIQSVQKLPRNDRMFKSTGPASPTSLGGNQHLKMLSVFNLGQSEKLNNSK